MNSEVLEIKIFHLNKKKTINIKNYIEKNSIYLKNEFLKISNKLEKIKIGNKSLYENFEVENNHNLWEMSLIKEKSNLKSKSIYKVIIFLALKKIINENKIDKIFFYNILFKKKIIHNLLKNEKIIFKFFDNQSSNSSIKFFLKSFFLIKFVYYLLLLIKKVFIELKYNNFKDTESNFLILTYFAHFKREKKGKLLFKQFGKLPNILKKHFSLNTQYIFVPNKDNLTINSLPNSIKNNYSMLNGNLNFFGKIKIILKFFFYSFKFYFLKKVIFFKLNIINSNILNILSEDYDSSFYGPKFIENLIWIEVFENYFSKTKKKKYGIFLLENQAWEKAMVTSWKNYSHGEILAYTPTSVNFWHLYNFDYSKKNFSSPSKVLVSSKEGYNLLKYQYKRKNIILKKVESLWFNYLLDIKKRNFINKNNLILIIGDYSPSINYSIFELIENSNLKKIKDIYFKPHPHDTHKYNVKNIKVTNKDNEFFFKYSSIIISPGSTAAILEYLFFGKKVLIYDNPNDLDLSPLKHLNYQFKFKSVKDLNKLLKLNLNKKQIINKFKNYYFLDKDLKKWKRFLYI